MPFRIQKFLQTALVERNSMSKMNNFNINAMPAPTWHTLHMNDVSFTMNDDLSMVNELDIQTDAQLIEILPDKPHEFDVTSSISRYQTLWEKEQALKQENVSKDSAVPVAEERSSYGGLALSDYQAKADALEKSGLLANAFETGCGQELESFITDVSQKRAIIYAKEKSACSALVVITGRPHVANFGLIDIHAASGARLDVTILVKTETCDVHSGEEMMTGTLVRVFADEKSDVSIKRVQANNAAACDIDSMGIFSKHESKIKIAQTILGSGKTFTGLTTDLRGDKSSIDIDTYYLGKGTQEHDFNYLVRHHGESTKSLIKANGILADKSKKKYRGTIDLIKGAKKAEGNEVENVLLVDEGVQNKSVPVILCNEDDVAGNHGATIGHIDPEQFFYLASRGLSKKTAEEMFVKAFVENEENKAENDLCKQAIADFALTL